MLEGNYDVYSSTVPMEANCLGDNLVLNRGVNRSLFATISGGENSSPIVTLLGIASNYRPATGNVNLISLFVLTALAVGNTAPQRLFNSNRQQIVWRPTRVCSRTSPAGSPCGPGPGCLIQMRLGLCCVVLFFVGVADEYEGILAQRLRVLRFRKPLDFFHQP